MEAYDAAHADVDAECGLKDVASDRCRGECYRVGEPPRSGSPLGKPDGGLAVLRHVRRCTGVCLLPMPPTGLADGFGRERSPYHRPKACGFTPIAVGPRLA